MGDIIVGGIVVIIVVLILRSMKKNSKLHSCDGNCGHCNGCH